MQESSTADGDDIMSKESTEKFTYAFSSMENKTVGYAVYCPLLSIMEEGYCRCVGENCAMWVYHMAEGKDTGKGHCGLVVLPRYNYHEQIA